MIPVNRLAQSPRIEDLLPTTTTDHLLSDDERRLAVEARDATLVDVQAAVAALTRLPIEPDEAMSQLQRLCLTHQLA